MPDPPPASEPTGEADLSERADAIEAMVAALATLYPGIDPAGAEADAEVIADALWLAALGARARGPDGQDTAQVPLDHPRGQVNPSSDQLPRVGQPDRAAISTRAGGELYQPFQAPEGMPGTPGRAILIPAGRSLPRRLELARSLRPFQRPWTAGRPTRLDIAATVDGFAHSRELMPVFGSATERWFELILVVDGCASMAVWRDTARELRQVLERTGAFRKINSWQLDGSAAGIRLRGSGGRPLNPDQVKSSGRRRVVVVLSDCTATWWRDGRAWGLLRDWARAVPTALVNPLPPKLWRYMGLDLPAVRVSPSLTPGQPNTSLRFHRPPMLGRSGQGTDWIPLPALALTPRGLGLWARMFMRADDRGCDAVLIPPRQLLEGSTRGGQAGDSSAQGSPAPQDDPGDWDVVIAFLHHASPLAARIAAVATLLDTDTIDLSVLRLISQQLVPEYAVPDLAEVVVSGLFTVTAENADQVVLTMKPGVRPRLRRLLGAREYWRMREAVSRHIAASPAAATGTTAILRDPQGDLTVPVGTVAFADSAAPRHRRGTVTDLRAPGSRAILIGASAYESRTLADLPAVADSVEGLRMALIERCGMNRESISFLLNPVGAGEVWPVLDRAAGSTQGVLMVYYAGHGLVGSGGELYLAVGRTDPADGRRQYTAIPYDRIRRLMLDSTAQATIVILDCCFSGLAQIPDDAVKRLPSMPAGMEGSVVISSSAREEYALAQPGERYTAFTGNLLTLLAEGAPDGPPELRLRDVYRLLDSRLSDSGLPRPQWQSSGTADNIVLTTNSAWRARQASDMVAPPVARAEGLVLAGERGVPDESRSGAPALRLSGSLPERAPAGRRVSLIAQVKVVAPPGGSALRAPLNISPGGRVVSIIVTAPGLISLGELEQDVHVAAGRDSDPVRFSFRTGRAGLHRVMVRAFDAGTFLAEMSLEISVEVGAPLQEGLPRSTVLDGLAAEPGEVTLQVSRADDGRYSFQLIGEALYPVALARRLAGDPAWIVQSLAQELRAMGGSEAPYASPALVRNRLRNLGAQLWADVVPEAIRRQFWEQADRIRMFTVASDVDTVPWELMYPIDGDNDNGFLVEQFPVIRRVYGQGRPRHLGLSRAAYVIPPGGPADAMDEVQAIRNRLGPGVRDEVFSRLDELVRLLNDAPSVLHFACHSGSAEGTGSAISLDGGPLRPSDVAVAVQGRRMAAASPLVFLSACRAADEAPRLIETMAWAKQFMGAGAGAFVGSLWPVRSSSAKAFAGAFYHTLVAEGEPLGIASLRARMAIAEDVGDPAWLAYTVYGNPSATIR